MSEEFEMPGYGAFVLEFNPLTGDLTVTSRTGVLTVEPIEPGKMRLSPRRRDDGIGVTV